MIIDNFFFLLFNGVGNQLSLPFPIRKVGSYSILDAGVLLSWFFCLFRPRYMLAFAVQTLIYHWDESLYVAGSIISILILCLFSSFSSISFKSSKIVSCLISTLACFAVSD
jgi:hypothetical protein